MVTFVEKGVKFRLSSIGLSMHTGLHARRWTIAFERQCSRLNIGDNTECSARRGDERGCCRHQQFW
jgi:uncharacterized protein (DUF885 family)